MTAYVVGRRPTGNRNKKIWIKSNIKGHSGENDLKQALADWKKTVVTIAPGC